MDLHNTINLHGFLGMYLVRPFHFGWTRCNLPLCDRIQLLISIIMCNKCLPQSPDDEQWNNNEEVSENLPKENRFQKAYMHTCKVLGVSPSACFKKGLLESQISLTNYELGPRGVKPICIALAVCFISF